MTRISNEITAIIEELSTQVGSAVDWTERNVLPQVQNIATKIIKYNVTKLSLRIIICTMIVLLCTTTAVILIKNHRKTTSTKAEDGLLWYWDNVSTEPTIGCVFIIIAAIIAFIIAVIIGGISISELLKWAMIPEGQLLGVVEEVAKDLKLF